MLSCRDLARRNTRHNSLVDDIHLWLYRRGIQVEKEVAVGEGQHRVDIWVRNFGTIYWADVTVAEPGCPSVVGRAAREEGVAAKLREQFKISKWRDMAREHGVHEMDIIPIAFETSGRRGDLGDEFLRRMARNTDGLSRLAPSIDALWLQLSVTMAKHNVMLLREAVRAATGVRSAARSRVGLGPLAA
jgi:hypothetical protein